jgi:hypothetical protein
MPKCYIAGPMRGYKNFNFDAFDDAAIDMTEEGHVAINPAAMDRLYEGWANYPPLDLKVDQRLKERCMRRDLEAIFDLRPENGDFVYMLKGWEQSSGALVEKALAEFLGLGVIYQ